MTKLHRNTTHEQIADSLIRLINSKPRSPTEAEILACLAGCELVDGGANDNHRGPAPHAPRQFAPTGLGREVIRRMPAMIEAMTVRSETVDLEGAPDFDAQLLAAADEAEDCTVRAYREAVDAVLGAANADPGRHVVDLAIVVRAETCEGCQPSEQQESALYLLLRAVLDGVDAPTQDDVCRRLSQDDLAEAA